MTRMFRLRGLCRLMVALVLLSTMVGCGSDESDDSDPGGNDAISSDGTSSDAPDSAQEDTGLSDSLDQDANPGDIGDEDALSDSSLGDAGFIDVTDVGPQLPCGELCGVNETCFEGVCIRECTEGLSVAELYAQLAAGSQIVANFCTDNSTLQAYQVLPSYEVLELRASSAGGSTDISLKKWPLYLSDGPAAVETLTSQSVSGQLETWEVLPAPFVATSSSYAFWGYATTADVLGGAVLKVSLSPPYTSQLQAAAGLGGGELLSDDDSLTYSFQLGAVDQGLGIYLHRTSSDTSARVVDDIGESSGDVVRVGDVVLISGYSDNWQPCDAQDQAPTAGKRVFAVSVQNLIDAFDSNTVVHARCDALRLDVTADFVGLADGFVLTREMDGAFNDTGLELHQLSVDTELGEVQFSDSLSVTEGAAFIGGRKMAGADIMLLQHEAGFMMIKADYLVTDPSTD